MERSKRSIDMLSRLPDEVLCHILSFLPTKTSVSTSVLAKRWRFLWAHVPNLEFSRYNFTGSQTQPLNIISRVLMLYEAKTVNTFNLFKVRGCPYQLPTLIIYPIKHGVRNLYLDFDFRILDHIILCTLPRLLFTCKTLVDLKLVCCGVIPSSGELFLPSLKKLNLRYVEYENDDSLPHLLSGCPVLEELIINDYFRKEQKNSGCVIVSSPSIKMLNVSIAQGLEHYPDEMLMIDVPALIYLEVYGCSLGHAKSLSQTMTSLIDAKFILSGECACGIDCTEQVRSVEFLSCLCHVTYLKISSRFHETPVLLVGNGSMAKFVNLAKLELNLSVDLHDVVKFLEVADNLQVLIINVCATPPDKEPERVPTCMLSRLRTFRMYNFYACQDASFGMVRYVLRNAQVLKKMEINPAKHISNDKNKLLDALRRISLFERGSKSCHLAFNIDKLTPKHD